MPETPEIQAHAERLTEDFAGNELSRFELINFASLKTFDPRPEGTHGKALVGVTRRGKYLILDFGGPSFIVHLMQGGRLKPDEKQTKKPRGGLARWRFADGRALLLTEPGTERKAGVWVVADPAGDPPPMNDLGPEAHELSVAELAAVLRVSNVRIHGFLRDQQKLAGLGRRLANEICHAARLSPFATTGKLTDEEIGQLHAAIVDTVAASLDHERTQPDMGKAATRPGAVHSRAGDQCPVCGDEVRAVEYRRYTVNYCATCQTDGKILADNTTSKFLK
ncbi:MAG: Fpg/Nei family DNA glycosylase [Actinomycetia bacterium]|nr:Fpg/Nei family DNA glycosylase [Actinomycetes bacterium]